MHKCKKFTNFAQFLLWSNFVKKQVNQHIEKTNDLREPVLQSKQKTKVEKTFAGIFIALGISSAKSLTD